MPFTYSACIINQFGGSFHTFVKVMDKRLMGKEKNKTTYELNWQKKYVAHWTDASLLSNRQYWQEDIEEKAAYQYVIQKHL